tara:strand:- start:422 stop:1003 length:582 start_codon:yes stop_codon:yes gene_type:complete
MSKHNIFIINYNPLYEILNEIKENLPFKIIKYENDFIIKSNLDTKTSLFISKSKLKSLHNKDLSDKNFLVFDTIPLPVANLVGLINIQLIKLQYNYQSKIKIKGYELNLNSKFFIKGSLSLKLTEKEIQIILYLNESSTKHNVLDLQKNIWCYSSEIETHTVETHIYRLRKKISDKFSDEKFIISHQNGYCIE